MEEEKDKIRDRRKKGWFYLDNEYLNGYAKIFGAIGTAIYVSLCRHADKNQKCFPSQKLISEELNIGERTVRNYLKRFEECNLISIERKIDGKTKKRINNVYWLLDKEVWKKPEATVAFGKEKARGNSRHKPEANDDKSQRQQVPIKETNEKKKTNIKETNIYISYKEKINSKSLLTELAKKKIASALKSFSEKDLLEMIAKKSVDEWFIKNNANRGISWFFSSKERLNRYSEEEKVEEKEEYILK